VAKRYSQYCPVAHSLDLVGERWALLVVRELLDGPKRYTDLLDGLPGIGTNILAGRLRDLEEGGIVVKRRLPPPAASTVYELTEYGAGLEEVLHALGRWGARSLGPPKADDALCPGWSLHAVQCVFDPAAAQDVDTTYELRVGGETVAMRVERGRLVAAAGEADSPALVVETDPVTLFELVARELDPTDAIAAERVRLEGDPDEFARLVSLLTIAPRAVVAA
jgi:DNA-binding HxlR family transcriptional regulator